MSVESHNGYCMYSLIVFYFMETGLLKLTQFSTTFARLDNKVTIYLRGTLSLSYSSWDWNSHDAFLDFAFFS